MAFFGVTKEKLEKVWGHPNADRLELGKLEGLAFQFVIAKGLYKTGDEVLYFPLDSELPAELQEKLGLTGKLSGKHKNRVKTIKLRGEISQGLVGPLSLLGPISDLTAEEITNQLGVTKYDPPPIISQAGNLVALPTGYSAYDIEGADRFGHIVDLLSETEVVVLEKMEGTNFSAGISADGKLFVNQRNHSIVEIESAEHLFWKVARKTGLLDWLEKKHREVGGQWMVYAELCGPAVQSNIYALKDHELFMFDVRHDYRWLSWTEIKSLGLPINPCPELFVGRLSEFLGTDTVQKKSNGVSTVHRTLREGIVIKPLTAEQTVPSYGRLIIKQRSPEYLAAE